MTSVARSKQGDIHSGRAFAIGLAEEITDVRDEQHARGLHRDPARGRGSSPLAHRLVSVYPVGISKIESEIDSVEIEVTSVVLLPIIRRSAFGAFPPAVTVISLANGTPRAANNRASRCAKNTCDVRHVDTLDHTAKMFRRLYQKAYVLVNHAPRARLLTRCSRPRHVPRLAEWPIPSRLWGTHLRGWPVVPGILATHK